MTLVPTSSTSGRQEGRRVPYGAGVGTAPPLVLESLPLSMAHFWRRKETGRVVEQLERHFRQEETHSAQKEGRAAHLGRKLLQQEPRKAE